MFFKILFKNKIVKIMFLIPENKYFIWKLTYLLKQYIELPNTIKS